MSAEPSPRPWTFCPTYGEHRPNSIIVDANGGNVALVCYFANEEEENRIGNLIVNAVNERDRLREDLESAKVKAESEKRWANDYFAQAQKAEAERDRLRDIVRRLVDRFGDFRFDEEDITILREARAAIGEGEK